MEVRRIECVDNLTLMIVSVREIVITTRVLNSENYFNIILDQYIIYW
jgi:hypothetical protein